MLIEYYYAKYKPAKQPFKSSDRFESLDFHSDPKYTPLLMSVIFVSKLAKNNPNTKYVFMCMNLMCPWILWTDTMDLAYNVW